MRWQVCSVAGLAFGVVLGASGAALAVDTVEGLTAYGDPAEINIGYRWMISGDDNLNASCTVRFRKLGDPTWQEGLDGWRCHENITPSEDGGVYSSSYKAENRFAGSIFWVEPGGTYEIELTLHDPDGVVGTNPTVVTATTRTEMVPSPTGRRFYVVPGSGGGSGTPDDPFLGLQAAHAAAQPGDVFYIASGTYSPLTITTSGSPGAPICWIGPPDRSAIIDGGGGYAALVLGDNSVLRGYWIIERLTLRNASVGCDAQRVEHVKFRHNIIYDVVDHGYINRRSYGDEFRQTVADNQITGSKPWVVDYVGSGEGCQVHGTASIVCHNYIQFFADGISIYPRYATETPPYGENNNCFDAYGNYVTRCGDDGIEADYIAANARIWRNVVTNCRMGVSNQPLYGGPCYVFRNEFFYLQDNGPGVGRGSAYKLHNGASGTVLIHNTSSKDARAFTGCMFQNSYFRNNIFMGSTSCLQMHGCGTNDGQPPDNSVNDWDYDAYHAAPGEVVVDWFNLANYYSVAALAAARGVEINGMAAEYSHLVDAVAPVVFGEPGVELSDFDLSLAGGAPEIDAGAVLPNINDPFVTDGAPDIGFLEYGWPRPEYGPRPVGDADRDFDVDQQDMVDVRNLLGSNATASPPADVWIDGLLDLKDVVFARNRMLAHSTGSGGAAGGESVHLELVAPGGGKVIVVGPGESFQLQVRADIVDQKVAAVAYEVSATSSISLTGRSLTAPLGYLPRSVGADDLPVVLGSSKEVALDDDPTDGDGVGAGADVLLETLSLQASASGSLVINLASPDAVYTNSQFPDGQTFGSITTGAGVTINVGPLPGDIDDDGDVDLDDYVLFGAAMSGPTAPTAEPDADLDGDGDCDLTDFATFSIGFTGSL